MKNLQETQGRGTGPKQKNLVRIAGAPSDIEGWVLVTWWWIKRSTLGADSSFKFSFRCVPFQGVSTSQSGLILGPENMESATRRCLMLFVGRVWWGDACRAAELVRWCKMNWTRKCGLITQNLLRFVSLDELDKDKNTLILLGESCSCTTAHELQAAR